MSFGLNDIIKKLGVALDNAMSEDIAWPNRDNDLKPPYLTFSVVPVSHVDLSLSGTGLDIIRGYLLINVVVLPNTFETEALNIAETIAAAIGGNYDTLFSAINILGPAEVTAGYNDGTYWRVPVKISFIATEKALDP